MTMMLPVLEDRDLADQDLVAVPERDMVAVLVLCALGH